MHRRLLQISMVLVASLCMMGAGSPSARFDRIGHKLMCTCGCAEILLECNHMGCPDSPGLIAALNQQLQAGGSEGSIMKWFAAQYGPTVLAAPIRGGFDTVAWIMPFAMLLLGGIAIVWLLRHWRDRHAATASTTPTLPAYVADHARHGTLRDQIRRDTTFEP